MALWTDVIDPATLTGYARASLEEYEQRKGSLASFLPNEQVEDINVRLNVGNGGLVESAHFRAFDAEPEYGAVEAGRRKNFELAAVSQKFALSEYDRLRARNASDEAVLNVVRRTTERAVTAVSDAVELLRGEVIATAKATTASSCNLGGIIILRSPMKPAARDQDIPRGAGSGTAGRMVDADLLQDDGAMDQGGML